MKDEVKLKMKHSARNWFKFKELLKKIKISLKKNWRNQKWKIEIFEELNWIENGNLRFTIFELFLCETLLMTDNYDFNFLSNISYWISKSVDIS